MLFEQFFYLSPSSIGGIYLQDIAIFVLLIYILWSAVSYGIQLDVHNDAFTFLSLFFELIIIIAAVVAYFHWGQGFLTSVLPERYLVIVLFSYLTIKMSLKQERVTSEQLLHMLLFLGKLELVVMMVQFVAQFGGVYFLHTSYNNSSYNFARFEIDETTIFVAIFFEISNLFDEGGNKIKSLLWIGVGIVFCFLMIQTRMILIGICVAVVIYYLTLNTSLQRKIFMTVVMATLAVLVYNTDLFQDTINIQESGDRNTMDIRISAMTFYLDELSESPLFGAGAYPNSAIANEDRNRSSGFNLNDNGLFGFVYMYGLVGAVWAICMYYNIIRKSYLYYKHEGQSGFFILAIYLVAISATLIHWYWTRSALLTLVIIWEIIQNNFEIDSSNSGFKPELEITTEFVIDE